MSHLHGSAQYLQHGGLLWDTPPRDLHNNYHNLCVSEVRPTWDFIILNKGRMTPPWRKKAKGSQAQRRVRFSSRVGRGAKQLSMQRSVVFGCAKNCIASNSTFSVVNMNISKSYLDLHQSESDWCRFVVQFRLSDSNEKHFDP